MRADGAEGETCVENRLPELLQLYSVIFAKFSQEGDGIWARFNM